jgi:hypothetical protein
VAALGRQLEAFARQSSAFNTVLVGGLVELEAIEAAPVMEQAFAAEKVDVWFHGDWEDVQIELGLLDQRTTPPPDYRAEMGWPAMGLLDDIEMLSPPRSQRKAKRKEAANTNAKAKAKRKHAKKSRKRKSRKNQRKRK